MGPGLFFALCGVLALPLRAERAVGLEAQGVDPMVALQNPGRLDVRDELGRSVSARLIEAQLKQSQVQAASRAAFSSVLPQAAAIAAVLEMLEALRLALRGGAAGRTPQRLFALPLGSRTQPRPALLVQALGIAVLFSAAFRLRFRSCPVLVSSRNSDVLRC